MLKVRSWYIKSANEILTDPSATRFSLEATEMAGCCSGSSSGNLSSSSAMTVS